MHVYWKVILSYGDEAFARRLQQIHGSGRSVLEYVSGTNLPQSADLQKLDDRLDVNYKDGKVWLSGNNVISATSLDKVISDIEAFGRALTSDGCCVFSLRGRDIERGLNLLIWAKDGQSEVELMDLSWAREVDAKVDDAIQEIARWWVDFIHDKMQWDEDTVEYLKRELPQKVLAWDVTIPYEVDLDETVSSLYEIMLTADDVRAWMERILPEASMELIEERAMREPEYEEDADMELM